ncbi:MAG: SulP family inorganic anion transporter, partial [archaeon]|nr:SulP family inorganic anion transporter [archaeon]
FFGLSMEPQEHIWENITSVFTSLGDANILAVAIALGTLAILNIYPIIAGKIRQLREIPPSIVALLLFTSATVYFALSVPIVGEIPSSLPTFSVLNFNIDLVRDILPSAFTIALLGSIEALLCAVVCDGMANSRHDSDKELKSQGLSNMVLPFFGAMPATAAIARSAVNIREGAKTKYAGVIHAFFLLLILLVFAPAAQFIPKAFLAGILMFVSLNMINTREFLTILHISKSDTIVLLVTFFLTVFTDLVFAVQIGMLFAIFLIFVELTRMIDVSHMEEYDEKNGVSSIISSNDRLKDIVSIYTINGPFFFGAMNVFDRKINEHIQAKRQYIILRMSHVTFIDSTGVARLNAFISERRADQSMVLLVETPVKVKKVLSKNADFTNLLPKEQMFSSLKDAVDFVDKIVAPPAPTPLQ